MFSLMKDHVDAVHGLSHRPAIPHVALDEGDGTVGHRPREILAASPDEVVQNPDFGGTFRFSGRGLVDGVEVIRGTFYLAKPPG